MGKGAFRQSSTAPRALPRCRSLPLHTPVKPAQMYCPLRERSGLCCWASRHELQVAGRAGGSGPTRGNLVWEVWKGGEWGE